MLLHTEYPKTHLLFNTLRPRQDGRHFADDIFKCVFLNEDIWISINISLRFVTKGPINNIPALVEIMAWRRPGDKSWSQSMMMSLLTHICVTRPQWIYFDWALLQGCDFQLKGNKLASPTMTMILSLESQERTIGQTECPLLPNRLSYRGSSKCLELVSPSS